jgi:hypothetical protein
MTGLCAVDKLPTFGLQIAFLNVGRQRPPLIIGPAFFSILGFKGPMQNIFNTRPLERRLLMSFSRSGEILNCIAALRSSDHCNLLRGSRSFLLLMSSSNTFSYFSAIASQRYSASARCFARAANC